MALDQKIIEIIAEQLGVDQSDVTPDQSFVNDLNADSLDITELMMRLEEKFGIEIPDDQAEKLATVGDVISFVSANSK